VAYSHGSAAYQSEWAVPARRIKKAVRAQVRQEAKVKKKDKKTALNVVLVFAVLFGLCWRYVAIYDQSSDIASGRAKLAAINAENSQIQMEIERETEKGRLDTYATDVLGMVKPDKSQFVYITLNKGDEMESARENNGGKDGFLAKLEGIAEYFGQE
jgi:cell division protein FtsB